MDDQERSGMEESTLDLIVDEMSGDLIAGAQTIADDAHDRAARNDQVGRDGVGGTTRPRIWVYSPANAGDHDAGNYRGQPIVPPDWAENTRPGWADQAGPGPSCPRRAGWRRRIMFAAVAVLVVVLAAVAGGLAWWQRTRVESAMADCEASLRDTSSLVDGLHEYLGSGDVLAASAITADQVADPDTVDGLADAVDRAGWAVDLPACEVSWTDMDPQGTVESLFDDPRSLVASRQDAVEQAVDAVLASRDKKILDDARTALQGRIDEANRLMEDSEGRVADEATRTGLRQAIDAGAATLDDGDAGKDALDQARQTLDEAMAAVNASIQARQEADAQAAAQAAAAATPSYQGSTGGHTGGYSSGSTGGSSSAGSSGGSASTGGSSASNSGNLDWLNNLVNSDSPYACQEGQYCPIG